MAKVIIILVLATLAAVIIAAAHTPFILESLVLLFSLLLLSHSLFTLIWMLYAWENPNNAKNHTSPKTFQMPFHSFTILIPARAEENVIETTIQSMSAINYPKHLTEVLILIREDDKPTRLYAEAGLKWVKDVNIKIVTFGGFPINKPHALNIGLKYAKNDIVAVFDAEDDPHKDILNVANTILLNENPDVIQSGVQLMNYKSRWFSLLNVLEYFFWFKSGLLFFSKVGNTTPLGGNSVFFKKKLLKSVGGWNEKCLTEDAEIGLRISIAGGNVKVVYDAKHATREETPIKISDFIKQRTRWNLGFLQVIGYGDWLKLGGVKKRLFSFYILFSPFLQTLVFFSMPLFINLAFSQKLPFLISFFAFFPLYIFLLQLVTWIFGSWEFTKSYKLKYSLSFPIKILFFFFLYQLLLTYASIKAVFRYFTNNFKWDKTFHANSHRQLVFRKKIMYEFN